MLFGVPLGMLGAAYAVAALVTGIELLTSQYPRTARFAVKSIWFHVYIIIYGLLAAGALALLPLVSDQVTITGVGASNPWAKAILIGFSVKAVLHIRIFSVTTGPGQSFPVGLESFVQLFEPWMLRELELDHYDKERAFIQPRAAKFNDPNPVTNVTNARSQAKANPPPGLSAPVRAVFEADIDQAPNPAQVIVQYLKYSGINLTKSTFP